MSLIVIAVGKQHEPWVSDGISMYQKRLRGPFLFEWVLLPHSSLRGPEARQEESERILSRLKPSDNVVLLDERGKNWSSPQFSEFIESSQANFGRTVIVIGGAYGVSEALRTRANTVWSLSNLVLPHQLVRLVLVEQLYRAQQIATGGSYHHE